MVAPLRGASLRYREACRLDRPPQWARPLGRRPLGSGSAGLCLGPAYLSGLERQLGEVRLAEMLGPVRLLIGRQVGEPLAGFPEEAIVEGRSSGRGGGPAIGLGCPARPFQSERSAGYRDDLSDGARVKVLSDLHAPAGRPLCAAIAY